MIRAGVFIGVDRTGGLQRLRDAASSATKMYNWALSQGITEYTHAKLITDALGQKVHTDLIYDAVAELLEGAGVDQLIVYFAGHGVNINRNEHWLLTDAPIKSSAAVDVTGSVELARYCGVKHVVFISDACRVASEGIQAQSVRGVDIFPNDAFTEKSMPVDQFFACCLGRTAAEIKDPRAAAESYGAIYTSALLDALRGLRDDLLERESENGDAGYVRLRPLQRYLEREVPSRVKAMKLQYQINQLPDALITSESAWLSRIALKGNTGRRLLRGQKPIRAPASASQSAEPTLRDIAGALVRSAFMGNSEAWREHVDAARVLVTGAEEVVSAAERIATPFGPNRLDSQSGIKIRGTQIVEFCAVRTVGELRGEGELLQINRMEGPSAIVLLRLSNRTVCLIPAFPRVITALTVEDNELVDVAYEPLSELAAWQPTELRVLRPLSASLSRHGQLRLDQCTVNEIIEKMRSARFVDPSLALYIAYACHDIQALESIRELSSIVQTSLGVALFDLELLGRTLVGAQIGAAARYVPPFPLVSHGFSLLRANRMSFPSTLTGLETTLQSSLWSLFDLNALGRLRDAIQKDGT